MFMELSDVSEEMNQFRIDDYQNREINVKCKGRVVLVILKLV